MQQWRLMLVAGCVAAGCIVPSASATAQQPSFPKPSLGVEATGDDPRPYMLRIDGQAAAVASSAVERITGSRVQARQAGRRQRNANAGTQSDVVRTARARGLIRHELYRVRTAYNGLAVLARPSDVAGLQRISGVRDVREISVARRAHADSVPTTGAPAVWAGAGGNVGQGVKIGVADSGVDYVHANFGGRGTQADLDVARDPANNPSSDTVPSGFTVTNGGHQIYPSTAVVGGIDLTGDDYGRGYGWVPAPDPNPMDCPTEINDNQGHGTHVAGTAAGRGVNADGTTYTGGYDSVPSTLKIAPGVAPGADIYAIRLFGCGEGTTLITQAIDWALDPNGDGDPSDRLDVLNLSVGVDYGLPDSADAAAAQNAFEQGLMVVVSAGNAGNRPMIVGAPSTAAGALSVANASTGRRMSGIEIAGAADSSLDGPHPADYSIDYPWHELSGPITAPIVRAPAANATGCAPYAESYAGQILVVDGRTSASAGFACGTAARAGHAGDAGAVGLVIADLVDEGLNPGGNETVPLALVSPEVRSALHAALADGAAPTVSFDPAMDGAVRNPATADTITRSSSRGPSLSGLLKPEIAAPGDSIVSARAGGGSAPMTMTGTSMAAPHASGAMALLRRGRPAATWSPEELKALLVNTARDQIHVGQGHTGRIESPVRVGSGTFDVRTALDTSSVAYAKDASGAIAVSAGRLQLPVGRAFSETHAVRVVNKGTAPQTFTVVYDEITRVPGADWVASPGVVTVPAGESRDVTVELRVPDPAALRATHDDTLSPLLADDAFDAPLRQRFVAEAAGRLRLTSADERLLVPVYAGLRPAAATATSDQATVSAESGDGELRFDGPTLSTGSDAGDLVATRMAVEWLESRPRLPEVGGARPPAAKDLRHVGVASDAESITFVGVTWGAMALPRFTDKVVFAVDRDRDGDADVVVSTQQVEDADAYVTCVDEIAVRDASPDPEENVDEWRTCVPSMLDGLAAETGTLDSRLTVLRVPRSMVGPTDGATEIEMFALTLDGNDPVDQSEGHVHAPDAPAFTSRSTANALDVRGLEVDAPGTSQFRWSFARATATGSRGILVVHPLGMGDQQAETVAVRAADPTPTPVPDPPVTPNPGPPVTPLPELIVPPLLPSAPTTPPPAKLRLPVHRRHARLAGARLTITGPKQCVRRDGRFTVRVSGKRLSRSASFRRIERVEFRLDHRRVATDRKAPFRQRLRLRSAKAGSLRTVTGRALIRLTSGKRMTKEIAVRVRTCA